MSRKSKAMEFVDEGYKIHVTGRRIEVTDPMKDYAVEKVAKIERFTDRIIDVKIAMDIQKLEQRVDIVMKVDHITIKAHAATKDMYSSIDIATDKLSRQVRRYKKRLQEHQAKGITAIDMRVNVHEIPDELTEINDEIEEENFKSAEETVDHRMVSTETRPLKVLTIDEALMKIDLSEDRFMIYQAEEDSKLKVIYRRADGRFGVIEPQM